MVLEVLFIVIMLLWFISGLPQAEGYKWTTGWFNFMAVLLLGLYVFVPALRG